jgi:general stress protein 26
MAHDTTRSEDAAVTARALEIVEGNRYLVIATASPDGTPWVTPVYFAHAGLSTFWWVSSPESRHSRLIAANPRVALTVFDSSVEIGQAAALYAEASATMCSDAEVATEIRSFSDRLVAHGAGPWHAGMVTGSARLRLYRARTTSVDVLAEDDGPDRRLPVPPPAPPPDQHASARQAT